MNDHCFHCGARRFGRRLMLPVDGLQGEVECINLEACETRILDTMREEWRTPYLTWRLRYPELAKQSAA